MINLGNNFGRIMGIKLKFKKYSNHMKKFCKNTKL